MFLNFLILNIFLKQFFFNNLEKIFNYIFSKNLNQDLIELLRSFLVYQNYYLTIFYKK